MNSRLKLAGGAALLVLAMASANAVYAQETSSALGGTVTANGAPVAGAAISIVHMPSGTRSSTVSNADGGFSSRGLRVGGPYTVTITAPGYPAKAFNDVFLQLGQTFDLPAEVAIAEVSAVEIVSTSTKNSEIGPKTVLNQDAIQSVVTINRDPRDLARRDALVSQDLGGGRSGTNGGGISIAGSNPRFNRISVDGVAAQDNFGLAQGGMSTQRGPVTLDAVEQFNIAAVPTDVENGDFIGGALNMVLRSGSNNFHGSLFVNYLNEGMVGKHIGKNTARIAPITSQENYGAFVSGPIIKDTLFFAAAYESYKTIDTTQFGPIGGGFANSFTALTQTQIDSVINTFNTNYASDYTAGDPSGTAIPYTQPVTDKKYSLKLDWNISDKHRASLTYRRAESTAQQRTDLNITSAALYSHWYQQFNFDEAITAEVHSDWSDNFSTFVKATYRDYRNGQNPPYGQNFADVQVCTAAASDASMQSCAAGFSSVRFGPDQFRHANSLDEQEARYQAQAEYTLGANRFKVGVQARKADVFDVFVPASDGLYYFDSLADFAAGKASSLTYTNAVSGNPNDAAFNTSYWTLSGYAQDTLTVTDTLQITAGVRVDTYSLDDKPIFNPNFLARNGFSNQGTIDGLYSVMPRVSFEWEPTDSLKFTGGLGLFSGGTPDVLTGTPFYNTGYATTSVTFQRQADGVTINETTGTAPYTQAIGQAALNGLTLDPKFGFAIPTLVKNFQQGTLPGATGIPTTGEAVALSPSFKMPGAWREYVSASYTVFDGWRLRADLVASQAANELSYYDGKAQPLVINGVQQFLPDGRIRYDGLANTIAGKSSTNLGANRDLIATNVDKGSNYTAAFSVSKSFDFGLDLSASYAKNSAEDTSSGLLFGTTVGSLYASVPVGMDPNRASLGRSYSDIADRYKLELGYRKKFFGDNETRVTLFGERFSGRPFGFISSDAASGRSPVFGVNQTAQALYVPDMSTGNATTLDAGLVHFATAADYANFAGYVTRFGLKPGLLSKYSNDNKDVNRLDLQISQELPSIIDGHKFRLQFDVRNVLNLIDADWGKASEYAENTNLARVSCADAAGNAVATTSAACPRYRYSSVPTTVTRVNNTALSLWYLQVGLRYEF